MTSVAAAQFFPAVASASADVDSLVVSVHDLHPSNRTACERILSELARRGAKTCSLLVVPDYHGRGNSMADPQYVKWLRGLESDGHEIVIHGYFHQRPRVPGETLRDKLVTRLYTQGEGEFYDISYGEASDRIKRAEQEFRAAGLNPRGFIAPAWLLSSEAERAARDADMEYTTRLLTVNDLRTADTYPARSLVYSVRSGWRRAASLAWNGMLSRTSSDNALMRLSIHPVDFEQAPVWEQILDILDRTVTSRNATTYINWIGEQRIAAAANLK